MHTSLIITQLPARVTFCPFSVAVMHIAWYSEDKPFAVGYADGKLLIGSKEPLEKGAIVVIDAHKVNRVHTTPGVSLFHCEPLN